MFGIPDPNGPAGEAVVEPAGREPIDLDDLRAFAVPASFDVTEALPREALAKLKKRPLREPYRQ